MPMTCYTFLSVYTLLSSSTRVGCENDFVVLKVLYTLA